MFSSSRSKKIKTLNEMSEYLICIFISRWIILMMIPENDDAHDDNCCGCGVGGDDDDDVV